MPVKLTTASLKRLVGVHPHLVSVIKRAAEISPIQFQVTCGVRTLAAQRKLVAIGASRTLKSRHIPAPNGLSYAVDLVVMVSGKPTWAWAAYARLADAVKEAARQLGIPLEWGGDWKSFRDGPHYQLPWAQYPGTKAVNDKPPPQPSERELSVLPPGSRGKAVMALQGDLAALGEPLKIDGDFGPATRASVLKMSARFGKPTDIVSAVLRDKIAAAAARARKAA